MKLLVFAHTPPPVHGQSLMVELLLDGLRAQPGERPAIETFHVNAVYSEGLDTIGHWQPGKAFRLLQYVRQAIALQKKHDIDTLYYVPAPGKTIAALRDLLVLRLCRPHFRRLILHWHAGGLDDWCRLAPARLGPAVRRALAGHDLSLILGEFSRAQADYFTPQRVHVLPNAIPDICPDFDKRLLPRRLARSRQLENLLAGEGSVTVCRVLFMTHCSKAKGLFDALEAIQRANQALRDNRARLRFILTATGDFVSAADRRSFDQIARQPAFLLEPGFRAEAGSERVIRWRGFVRGVEKNRLLEQSDAFIFPSKYPAETAPVAIIEALSVGLPVVATQWRGIPEMLPAGLGQLAPVGAVDQLAAGLTACLSDRRFAERRKLYRDRFSPEAFHAGFQHAARALDANTPK